MAKRKSLFDISREYHDTLDELETYLSDNPDAAGELPDTLIERLSINKDELDEKLDAYFYTIKELETEIDILKSESARLALKAKSKLTTIENLKKLVTHAVITYGEDTKTGGKKYAHSKFTISVIYNSPVVVEDEDRVPADLKSFDFNSKGLNSSTIKELKEYLQGNPGLYDRLSQNISITGKIDKKLLKTALKDGEEIQGAKIDETANYLRFT
jgi:uncharacterized protein YfeS